MESSASLKSGLASPSNEADRGRADRTILRWLTWGSFIPVAGWLYAVLLVWGRDRLARRDKLIATLAIPGGWFTALALGWWVTRETAGVCYRAQGGPVGGDIVTETGCQQLGALSTSWGLVLLIAVVAAAALGPAWTSRQLHSSRNPPGRVGTPEAEPATEA